MFFFRSVTKNGKIQAGESFFGRRGFLLRKFEPRGAWPLCCISTSGILEDFLRVDVGHQRRLSVKVLGGVQLLRRYGFATVHGEIGGTVFKVSFYYNEGNQTFSGHHWVWVGKVWEFVGHIHSNSWSIIIRTIILFIIYDLSIAKSTCSFPHMGEAKDQDLYPCQPPFMIIYHSNMKIR